MLINLQTENKTYPSETLLQRIWQSGGDVTILKGLSYSFCTDNKNFLHFPEMADCFISAVKSTIRTSFQLIK